MLLHLPIGFFLLTVILLILKDQFKQKAFRKIYQLTLALTAATLVVTALMGVVISREGGYEGATLDRHLNLGVLLSLLMALLVGLPITKPISKTIYVLTGLGFILIVLTGHFGATLTHGDNYVLAPLMKEKESEINRDSLSVFRAAIFPMLDRKCISCHNPKKKKGELILIDEENILKGGESGLVIVPEKLMDSEILKRILLDVRHEDHMPPSGKPQLTASELSLFKTWVAQGAEFQKNWSTYSLTDSIKILGDMVWASYQQPKQRQYDFDFASNDIVKELNTPYRSVSRLSADAPALKADFHLAKFFKTKDLKELSEIKLQLTELNLSGMPIGDKEIELISQFKNVEILNLNNTQITDKAFGNLISLPNLKKLLVAGTKVSAKALENISKLENLKEVYLWNTLVTPDEVDALKSISPMIKWYGGQKIQQEKLKLTSPILVNETFILGEGDKITFKHNLPGTVIRYTLDGSKPDSINGTIYKLPIAISNHTQCKTIATKDGWLASSETDHQFYRRGLFPKVAKINSVPHKDYKADGATTLSDGQIGDADNFREGSWVGFKENKFEATFQFDKQTSITEITLLYNRNLGSYIMPPKEIEIWGGESEATLKLIKKFSPAQPTKYEPNKVEAIFTSINIPYAVYKIIATPLGKLPDWHNGKGEKSWVMVSEVIFR